MKIEYIAFIIILAGLLGGFTNFFLQLDLTFKKSENFIKLLASLCLSLCASATIPLFLQILSNGLLDLPSQKNYLIFSGFCVLASFFAKRYLDDVYQKINKIESQIEKAKKETTGRINRVNQKAEIAIAKVDDLEESAEEIENNELATQIESIIKTKNENINLDQVQNFIAALFNSKYSIRTTSGISKDSGIDKTITKELLQYLQEFGITERKIGTKGQELWRVLKNPIKIYSASYGSGGKTVDVTEKIKELVGVNILEGPVNPSFLAVDDPAYGTVKILRIHCRIRGRERELKFSDGQIFKIQ